jgi:hypothetical protein
MLLFYLRKSNKSQQMFPFLNVAYIANSKTGVEFREIFQSGKGFQKYKSLRSSGLRV